MKKFITIAALIAALALAGSAAATTTSLHFTRKAAPGFQSVLRQRNDSPTAVCRKLSARRLHCYHMIQSGWIVTFDARPVSLRQMHVLIIASKGGSVSKKVTFIRALKGWIVS
jgi:hypothetical protein